MALARWRTGQIAEVLIVMLRTLPPAVTDVFLVHTDSRATTAVETRASWVLAVKLVVVVWTVIHSVTTYVQGQAETMT